MSGHAAAAKPQALRVLARYRLPGGIRFRSELCLPALVPLGAGTRTGLRPGAPQPAPGWSIREWKVVGSSPQAARVRVPNFNP